jgi:hypothetical protein
MRQNILVLLIGLSVGCQNIHKLPGFGNETPPVDNTPTGDVVTYNGVTRFDNEIVQNIRTTGCAILVRVQRPGEDWTECNKWEVRIDQPVKGLGDVWFLGQCDLSGGVVRPLHKPVAPVGTNYQITSLKLASTAQ